jgi:uncharacterized protein YjbI with pentapeptide repeats
LKAENQERTTLLQTIAGLLVIVGAGAAWRQAYINQEAQITERFNKAIDHLGEAGEGRLDVRLGGIFGLERIAKNSPADRTTVSEVLTAYVRSRSSWMPSKSTQPQGALSREDLPTLQARAGDIQAILTVLGRRALPPGEPIVLDLSMVDLRKADLRRARLDHANLRGANLQDANLQDANLQDANLQETILHGASLRRANLRRADLTYADLTGTGFVDTKLQEATLLGVSVDGEEADFTRANLRGTYISGDLPGVILSGADLREADLLDVNLQGARLEDADLRDANLENADLRSAIGNATTLWPDGFDEQSAGVVIQPDPG